MNLELIATAYPDRDPAWHREQARNVLSAVSEAGSPAVYPMTPKDLADLHRDFAAGKAVWRRATFSGDKAVEVTVVAGIFGVRDASRPTKVLLFTKAEWHAFAQGIINRDFAFISGDPRSKQGQRIADSLPEDNRRELVSALASAAG
jgi:hypothetical protein